MDAASQMWFHKESDKIQIQIRYNEIVNLFEDLHAVPLGIIHIVHMQSFPKTNICNPLLLTLVCAWGLEMFVLREILRRYFALDIRILGIVRAFHIINHTWISIEEYFWIGPPVLMVISLIDGRRLSHIATTFLWHGLKMNENFDFEVLPFFMWTGLSKHEEKMFQLKIRWGKKQ